MQVNLFMSLFGKEGVMGAYGFALVHLTRYSSIAKSLCPM